ncbi:MAG: hypothetical protein E7281_05120 [Lachnospiraceae bacterium]|nr:hypothetical protein [Lachnospiraceae bacterium]
MIYKVQNIIFPENEKSEYKPELFYKKGNLAYDKVSCKAYIAKYMTVDFSTYFNSFSNVKWNKYTNMKSVELHLMISGDFSIRLFGYKDTEGCVQQFEIAEQRVQNDEAREVVLKFGDTDCDILAFSITTFSDCVLENGGYYIDNDAELNEVRLALATTTFKQEHYIIPNIENIKKHIINSDEDIAKNFEVFVIDNGRTLDVNQFECDQVQVVPNPNAGGSGGFCRGMMCAIDSPNKPTHLLLMDDDVMIIPESIIRTYNLYRCVNDEWKDAFVSGAMLSYEKIVWQEEDMGYVVDEGLFAPVKKPMNISKIQYIVKNDAYHWEMHENTYAPWWYCCIPMKYVRNDNLPLPLFVRGDDSEFSIRNHCKIMTMNSIGIWHKGFAAKHFASKEYYQVYRNAFIAQAISGEFQNARFIDNLRKYFNTEINRLNYVAANQLCDALEDYLKGPSVIENNNGAEMMMAEGKKNEVLKSFDELGLNIDLESLYEWKERSFMQKVVMKITQNGHKYLPSRFLKSEPGVLPFDLYTWFPQKSYRRKTVIAVSELDRTAVVRHMDKAQYKKVMNRWDALVNRFNNDGSKIASEYAACKDRFTSREFWNKYLEIEE